MQIKFVKIVFLLILFSLTACKESWDEHYNSISEVTVKQTVWELLLNDPDYSKFTDYLQANGLDSLFKTGRSITVFVPDNAAFDNFNADTSDVILILRYHISETVFNTRNVEHSKMLETSTGKFALIENNNGEYFVDGVKIYYSSPLCSNGKYYEIHDLLYPKPTLYEYIAHNSGILKDYIDQFDSVYLDHNLSTPLGYDSAGNTIYDSVFTYINLFDSLYFPVPQEFRQKTATFLLFDETQYRDALDEMASNLTGNFHSFADIPEVWQLNVLLPGIVKNGIFEGSFQYEDFCAGKLKSIAGDTVFVDCNNIDPDSRFICSNGVVFKYLNFSVPDSLYKNENKMQGESLVKAVGAGVFNWQDWVKITGSNTTPVIQPVVGADNDTIISLNLGIRYNGTFKMEFYIKNLFPQKYRFVCRANSRPSGIYEIYVNDEYIGEIDLYDLRKTVRSVTGEFFIPDGGYNKFDFWVDNITDFGDVKIAINYIESGASNTNGLAIDYVSLIPE